MLWMVKLQLLLLYNNPQKKFVMEEMMIYLMILQCLIVRHHLTCIIIVHSQCQIKLKSLSIWTPSKSFTVNKTELIAQMAKLHTMTAHDINNTRDDEYLNQQHITINLFG